MPCSHLPLTFLAIYFVSCWLRLTNFVKEFMITMMMTEETVYYLPHRYSI